MKTADVGKATRYSGFKSFQYLEAGTDYREFKLAKELGRVPSRKVEVSGTQEDRVQRLLAENLAISLHDHCFVVPADFDDLAEYRRQGRDVTGYAGMAQSGLDAVFDCLMDGTATITSKAGWKWDDIIYDLGMRLSDIAHQDFIVRGETLDDIRRAKGNGQIAFIASLEAATAIENEVDRLDILYGLGIRSSGIAYSEANTLGSGLKEARDGGLTEFGRQAVRRMNKLGIAIDISHSGDQTSMDTIQMEHFEYCADLVGIDHVAFGPDTLFGDHVGLHHYFAKQLSIKAAHGTQEFEEVEYVDGIENPAEAFPNIVRWLVKHDYSDGDIAKAVGGNVMRVLEEVWFR